WASAALAGLTAAGVGLNVVPTIVHKLTDEMPSQAVSRWPIHAEMGALKLTQLLLPVTNHRIRSVARLKEYYNSANALLVNANYFPTLGLVTSVGFCISLFGLAWRKSASPSSRLLVCLGFLNVAAILLATMGGLGSIFSTFLSPWIRGYYRICVFIAFASVFSLAVMAQIIRQTYVRST